MNRFNRIKRAFTFVITLAIIFTMPTTALAAPISSDNNSSASISYPEITQDMALAILQEYTEASQNSINNITSDSQARVFLEDYVQYAVDNGYIADTPEQRAGLTVAVVRGVLNIAAGAGGLLYKTAGEYLKHSLQDNPSDLIYGPDTTYADQIKESSEFDDIIEYAKSLARGFDDNVSIYMTSGSTSLESTVDLLLSYRAIRYNLHMKRDYRDHNVWNIEVTFKDTYDFDSDGWSEIWDEIQTGGLIDGGAEFLNMCADAAMDIGAIVEYDIKVTVESSFRE